MIPSLFYGIVTYLLLLRPCPSLPTFQVSVCMSLSPPKVHHCFRSSITSFVSLCPNTDTDTDTKKIEISLSLPYYHHHHLQHNKKNITCNIITKIQLYLRYLPTYLLPFRLFFPIAPRGPGHRQTHARTQHQSHRWLMAPPSRLTDSCPPFHPIPVRNSMTGPTFLSFVFSCPRLPTHVAVPAVIR